MTIKPVLVPDHDAADLRKLMDHFATAAQTATPAAQANRIKQQLQESRPDVMRHRGDKTVKIVKRAGKPIGEIGTDAEASAGNGAYYVKLYDGSYDAVGYDTAEEALAELKAAIKQGVAEARVAQISPNGADYSKHSTEALKAMLRPGVMHRNELKFKTLIRRELRKREQQGVAEGSMYGDEEVSWEKGGRRAPTGAFKNPAAEGMPANKHIATELDTLLTVCQNMVEDIKSRSRSGYGNNTSERIEDAVFEISGLSNGFHSSMAEGIAALQELMSGSPRMGKWILRNLKKVGNRIDLPQLIQSETSKKSGVAEGHGDANRLEHRGTEYNVYFNTGKGMYTARGTGQMKGQIAPQWFRTLADAQEHAETEIGGYDDKGVTESVDPIEQLRADILRFAR